jgi:hypothetical protein
MMIEECKSCTEVRNCINGHFCAKLKKYVEYSRKKECNKKNNDKHKENNEVD